MIQLLRCCRVESYTIMAGISRRFLTVSNEIEAIRKEHISSTPDITNGMTVIDYSGVMQLTHKYKNLSTAIEALARSIVANTKVNSHVVAVLDHPSNLCSRRDIYAYYKGYGRYTPGAMVSVRSGFLEFAAAHNIGVCCAPFVEADDTIATLCTEVDKAGIFARMSIISEDKDLNPLTALKTPTTIYRHVRRVHDTFSSLLSSYQVSPEIFEYYLALFGDVANGIPGLDDLGPAQKMVILSSMNLKEYSVKAERVFFDRVPLSARGNRSLGLFDKKWRFTPIEELSTLLLPSENTAPLAGAFEMLIARNSAFVNSLRLTRLNRKVPQYKPVELPKNVKGSKLWELLVSGKFYKDQYGEEEWNEDRSNFDGVQPLKLEDFNCAMWMRDNNDVNRFLETLAFVGAIGRRSFYQAVASKKKKE